MELQTTAELMAEEYPPIRWAVPGIIPEGVTVFAAPWKAGKSRVILDCKIAVATGTEALGGIVCDQGAALYAALEDGPRRAQTRVLMTQHGRPDPGDALVWTYHMPPLDEGGLEGLDQWLADNPQARMVTIDVYGKVRGKGKGYTADYAAIAKLKALSQRHGDVSIVLVTHTNKKIDPNDPTASIDGSKGLVGAADCILVMLRDRGESVATLVTTGKDMPDARHPLSLVDGRWVITEETPAHRGIKGARATILTALQRAGKALSGKELAMATGLSYANVRKVASQLEDVTNDGDGYRLVS